MKASTDRQTLGAGNSEKPRQPKAEHYRWAGKEDGFSWCFLGKGPGFEIETIAAHALNPSLRLAWLKQVHADLTLTAKPGLCGEGDALVSREPGLALGVVTADCVPVLLAGEGWIAAAHAGWRGIEQGILASALVSSPGPAALRAWIGPAIGACCYEVGADVAERVTKVSSPAAAFPGPGGKPHLDLQLAVREQLEQAGLRSTSIRAIERCTRCHSEELYSYRRDGKMAGRNVALIWLDA